MTFCRQERPSTEAGQGAAQQLGSAVQSPDAEHHLCLVWIWLHRKLSTFRESCYCQREFLLQILLMNYEVC